MNLQSAFSQGESNDIPEMKRRKDVTSNPGNINMQGMAGNEWVSNNGNGNGMNMNGQYLGGNQGMNNMNNMNNMNSMPQNGGSTGASPWNNMNMNGLGGDAMTSLGLSYGSRLLSNGTRYASGSWLSFSSMLRPYFDVTTKYVLHKLKLVLWPYSHKNWSRRLVRGYDGGATPLPPRDDLNSPDLYIPLMSFLTYIIFYALIQSMLVTSNTTSSSNDSKFGFDDSSPLFLARAFSTLFAAILFEVLAMKLGFFLVVRAVSDKLPILDMVALVGYSFIGLFISAIIALPLGSVFLYYILLLYTGISMGVVLVKTVRMLQLDAGKTSGIANSNPMGGKSNRSKRNYFLLALALCQPLMYIFIGKTMFRNFF